MSKIPHYINGVMSSTSDRTFFFPDNHHGTGSSASSSTGASNSHHSSSVPSPHQPPPYNSNMNNGSSGGGYIQPYQPKSRMRHSSSISSGSEFTSVSQQVPGSHLVPPAPQNQSSSHSGSDREPDRVSVQRAGVLAQGRRQLGVAAHLAQSRESFQQALDNPCQFIDVI